MSQQKIEQFWRDATAEDALQAIQGKEVEARYRKNDSDDWRIGFLCGAVNTGTVNFKWYCYDGYVDDFYRFCQVYDPPSWFKNKPDPGEGWRILHPDERVEKGDEYYSSANNMWLLSGSPDTCNCKQGNFPYRRRIEPKDPGGDWEPTDDEIQYAMDRCGVPTIKICVAYETQVDEVIQLSNGKRFKVTQEGFEVL